MGKNEIQKTINLKTTLSQIRVLLNFHLHLYQKNFQNGARNGKKSTSKQKFSPQLGNFPTVSKLSLCRVIFFPFWSWERRACADWFELVSSSRFQPVFTLSLSCALVLREWEGEKTHFFSIFFSWGISHDSPSLLDTFFSLTHTNKNWKNQRNRLFASKKRQKCGKRIIA